jgi:hypothetical protein
MCTCWPAIAVMSGERGRERELAAAGPGDILITAMGYVRCSPTKALRGCPA